MCLSADWAGMFILPNSFRRPDGSVGMAFVLPALTDPVVRIPAGPLRSLKCDPPKGTGADHKKSSSLILLCIVLCSVFRSVPLGRVSLLLALDVPVLVGRCLCASRVVFFLAVCFMATKASALGLCPLHHVVGVVHVPLAAALRYSPSGDPESP